MISYLRLKLALVILLAFTRCLHAQVSLIVGVTDRTVYTDTATFTVPTVEGFTYEVMLNDKPVAAGVPQVVTAMDYYDLVVQRTQASDGSSARQAVRFIVVSSRRGSPEVGLIEWTPYPLIPSGREEFAEAKLFLVAPQEYPAGLEIPMIAWVDDGPGNARRVNGTVIAAGLVLPLRRGVGHAFMAPATTAGILSLDARIQMLSAAKSIQIDSMPAWQVVSGILPAEANWPTNSRIHVTNSITVLAGNSLTIGAGTVVLLDPSVNITNTGRIEILGTREAPVVLTAQKHVAPEHPEGAWGGFLMRGSSAELIANGTIMTGAGASASFNFSPGVSHRSEQALLLVHSGAKAFLTNCFLINNAGQIGNGYDAEVTYDHCLLQRAITGGEYEGGTVIVNNSAVIEFPAIDGVYNATIADADYDAIYFTTGTHILKDSLLGFAKDDAIDSGSGGAGSVVVTNCWVESALHEALAWSGGERQTLTYDSILINSGQGIECGWSTGTNSPLCYAERLLSLANSVGARYGDNYQGTTGLGLKTGFLTVTNSILIHNYRDVFGRPWDDTWDYRSNRMSFHGNHFSASNAYHPDNLVWDPTRDAARLLPFMGTPRAAAVGIGFANWDPVTRANVANGIPIRLSSFTTHDVQVDYTVDTPSGTLAMGHLDFRPGETVKVLTVANATLPEAGLARVSMQSPVGAEITTAAQLFLLPADTNRSDILLIPYNASWHYLDEGSDQGTAWRASAFDESSWLEGPAQLGFGDNDEATQIRRVGTLGTTNITYYFRKTFTVADPSVIASMNMRLLRDDAGVVYLNGAEIFRSANLPPSPAQITFTTLALSTGENSIDSVTLTAQGLQAGENTIAVEIHQESTTSSDVSFDLELVGVLVPAPPRLQMARFGAEGVLYWRDPTVQLESATTLESASRWSQVKGAESPFIVPFVDQARYYRLAR